MEQRAAYIPLEGVNQQVEEAWAQEIRDYLLGRLAKNSTALPLKDSQIADLDDPPIRRWWIFEGKRYRMFDGPLARNLEYVVRSAYRLSETFNPRLRLSDRPEGVVDWGQTLARGPHRLRQEYVVLSSGIGLNEQEHAALWGWMRWLAHEWGLYRKFRGDSEPDVQWPNFAGDVDNPLTQDRLRRWAHTARRSRWPLLHGVVAESLRSAFEPEELDRIPLPEERATLFELLCLVRVARCVAPSPRELRWLSSEIDNNQIKLDGVRVHYQQTLDREVVLATSEYAGPLASAVRLFNVSIPQRTDLAFDFETTRGGFDGLIIEAKSGNQLYEAAVGQLRTYRSARPRLPGARYLIWGIVENQPDASFEELCHMFASADKGEDVWVFSSADAIPVVLSAALDDGSNLQNTT